LDWVVGATGQMPCGAGYPSTEGGSFDGAADGAGHQADRDGDGDESSDGATESSVDRIGGENRHCHTANTGQYPGSDTGQKQPARSTKVVFSKPPLDGTANRAEHDHTEDEVELGASSHESHGEPRRHADSGRNYWPRWAVDVGRKDPAAHRHKEAYPDEHAR
jgi:hypothetical protein